MADNLLLERFQFENFFTREKALGGKIAVGGQPSLVLPLSLFALLEESAAAGGNAPNLLYDSGLKLGNELFSALSSYLKQNLNVESVAKVPFPDYLTYLNAFLSNYGAGSVSLGKEEKAIVVTHKGGPNTAGSPNALTFFFAGFWAGMFNFFGGGKLKATPKNSLPAESVVYLLNKG